jgi:lipopolysaccharide heptosyltransferase II
LSRLSHGERVLLRLPNWLGDLVLAEPLVNALDERARCGHGSATLVGPARMLALFDGRFEALERLRLGVDAAEDPRAWRGHDAAVFLNASFKSVLCAWRAGIPERCGWLRGGRTWMLTSGAVPARERGAAALGRGRKGRRPRYLPRPFETACQELAGGLGITVTRRRPLLVPSSAALAERAERAASVGVDLDQPYLLLNAAGRPGSAKAWPAARWLELIHRLQGGPLPLVVVSAPDEDEVAKRVAAQEAAGVYALQGPAPELPELLAWTAGAAALVTVDSGPRHLATATSVPAVVLYGSTDPRHTADFLTDQLALTAEVPCAPCHRERCPLHGDAHLACLDALRADDVRELVERVIVRGDV